MQAQNLSSEELQRYSRQIILPELGNTGQKKLKSARVLVIGAGGLGCPVLQYLVAAGIGHIGIADHDTVDHTNLHRQVLYNSEDIGKSKAERAKEKLSIQNHNVNINSYNFKIDPANCEKLISEYQIIVDCSDNFETRYLLNDFCFKLDKPLVSGSIFKFEGQLSVFNYKGGPTYRCLFPEPPADHPNCAEIGVIGILPGIIGSLQANEVIKIISGMGEVLSGKLLTMNSLTMEFRLIKFKRSENLEIKQDSLPVKSNIVKEITPVLLKIKLQSNEPPQIIDVREDYEYSLCHLPSIHIPLNLIPAEMNKISRTKEVVILCHHGMRSYSAIRYLQENFNFNNLYNLEGGIHAWSEQVDPEMTKY